MFTPAKLALAVLLAATTPAWAQSPAAAADAAPAQKTMPAATPAKGMAIDQPAVKRAATPTPAADPAAARKAGPLARNGGNSNGAEQKSFFESRSNTNPRAATPVDNAGGAGNAGTAGNATPGATKTGAQSGSFGVGAAAATKGASPPPAQPVAADAGAIKRAPK